MTSDDWYELVDTAATDSRDPAGDAVTIILKRMAELIRALEWTAPTETFTDENSERAGYEQAKGDMLALLDAPTSQPFALPPDAALGDAVLCPTCGAVWENVTSKEPTWMAHGYEG